MKKKHKQRHLTEEVVNPNGTIRRTYGRVTVVDDPKARESRHYVRDYETNEPLLKKVTPLRKS